MESKARFHSHATVATATIGLFLALLGVIAMPTLGFVTTSPSPLPCEKRKHKKMFRLNRENTLTYTYTCSCSYSSANTNANTNTIATVLGIETATTNQQPIMTTSTSTSTRLRMSPVDFPFLDSTVVVTQEQESWRQYVPLVVSLGIIVDILLGSPLANAVLKPMRPPGEDGQDGNGETKDVEKPRSKARIDTELVAQQALDRASNALELKNFLEERKTDYDRMEEMKRKLDRTMQDLDEEMEARQRSIDGSKTP